MWMDGVQELTISEREGCLWCRNDGWCYSYENPAKQIPMVEKGVRKRRIVEGGGGGKE